MKTKREIYGAVLNFCRKELKTNPEQVKDFDELVDPEGVYIMRVDEAYIIRHYMRNDGLLFKGWTVDSITLYISELDTAKQKSKLKLSYVEAVEQGNYQLLPGKDQLKPPKLVRSDLQSPR